MLSGVKISVSENNGRSYSYRSDDYKLFKFNSAQRQRQRGDEFLKFQKMPQAES